MSQRDRVEVRAGARTESSREAFPTHRQPLREDLALPRPDAQPTSARLLDQPAASTESILNRTRPTSIILRYMPASTPVRVAIVIAALAALLGGYWWWSNPARHVHRLLSDVASALSHDGAEADLRSIAAVASLQAHLTPDVSVDIGGASTSAARATGCDRDGRASTRVESDDASAVL